MARNQKQLENLADESIINETEDDSEYEDEEEEIQPMSIPAVMPKRRRGMNASAVNDMPSTSQAVATKGKGRKRKAKQSDDPDFDISLDLPSDDNDRILNRVKIGKSISGKLYLI